MRYTTERMSGDRRQLVKLVLTFFFREGSGDQAQVVSKL